MTCIGLAQGPIFYVSKTDLLRRLASGVDVGEPVRGVLGAGARGAVSCCSWPSKMPVVSLPAKGGVPH